MCSVFSEEELGLPAPKQRVGLCDDVMQTHLEQQLADLILPFGCGLVQRSELPQVGHVDGRSVSDQQLSHLVVTVGAGVVQGNQAAGGATPTGQFTLTPQ